MRFRLNKQSLSKQLLLGFGLSLGTVGLATLLVNYHQIQIDLGKQVQERAQSITQSIEFSTEGLLELENKSILYRVVQNYATLPAVIEVAIVAPDGTVMAHSSRQLTNRSYYLLYPELMQQMEEASKTGLETSQRVMVNGRPALAQMLPFSSVMFGTAGQRGLAIAIVDLKQMQQEVERTFVTSTFTFLAGIVVILLLMATVIQRIVLHPLNALNEAVAHSKQTGIFTMPAVIPANEIRFLADTFDTVFRQLEAYDQLKVEIAQRQQVEATLRDSEARERNKSQELEAALQELKQTQSQLIQSEKMSSLGQLVAGVAHEINNPVNFIHGNVHHADQYTQDLLTLLKLYQMHYPMPVADIQNQVDTMDLEFLCADLPKLLTSMRVGAERIRKIVQSLRAFSRLDEAEIKNVDIHEGIDSTLMILHSRLKEAGHRPEIQVIKEYGNLPKIECYAGQLNQVFMNILSNAIEALDELHEQRSPTDAVVPSIITIKTKLLNQNWITIQIADNGPGMTEQVQTRLFDPFFTTKPVGKGTGMGMSISHQVITQRHHGSLQCISSPGNGTEFIIKIPASQTRATDEGTDAFPDRSNESVEIG
ncbi:HAMP domain-containing histidine kinase [Oculatella sp. LEGE 06141]|uniref:sensor histidine kinase n=1 Tax=Oculatella sp. LEGE 06141 TaxID=1828648 RepID=UPI00187F3FBB|nr:ATP-binding protein [Oculatella sp. LEGE 06141]MBE9180017.1 HAMP domain-containing histidine kinase [Oculatella sp. LEGE 06141]